VSQSLLCRWKKDIRTNNYNRLDGCEYLKKESLKIFKSGNHLCSVATDSVSCFDKDSGWLKRKVHFGSVGHDFFAKYFFSLVEISAPILYKEKRLFVEKIAEKLNSEEISREVAFFSLATLFENHSSKKVEEKVTYLLSLIRELFGKDIFSDVDLNPANVRSAFVVLTTAFRYCAPFLDESAQKYVDQVNHELLQKVVSKSFSSQDAGDISILINEALVLNMKNNPRMSPFGFLVADIKNYLAK